MFLDEAIIELTSGQGGAGAATFHREKHVPLGGPNGADGGRGGDIILIADRGMRTLYDFKLKQKFKAGDGSPAVGNKTGKDGDSVTIKVPVGTIVFDEDSGDPIVDLATDGMRYVICKGGKGGFGNLHYTNSVRQAPRIAQKGAPGDYYRARFELKLLADVGLIGLPNAGKSTLISTISAAKPKIADYPFTTIVPNLGVVSYKDSSFTVADMPGLIEGASEGKGLGHTFLKHVERTSVLVHLVECLPADESDPILSFEMIEEELKRYSYELWKRPRIIALTKIDLIAPEEVGQLDAKLIAAAKRTLPHEEDVKVFPISSATTKGVDGLVKEMAEVLERESSKPRIPIITPEMTQAQDTTWDVVQTEEGFAVTGKRISRMVAMTNLDSEEGVSYLHRRLQRIGVIDKLREEGASEGDTVKIGDVEFDFSDL